MQNTKTDDVYRFKAEMLWMRIILRAMERFKYGIPKTTGVSWNGAELIAHTE